MLIECIIRREGGSRVSIGSATYHFTPNGQGAHVADVDVPEHAERLLSIAEAYRAVEGQSAPQAEAEATARRPRAPRRTVSPAEGE